MSTDDDDDKRFEGNEIYIEIKLLGCMNLKSIATNARSRVGNGMAMAGRCAPRGHRAESRLS